MVYRDRHRYFTRPYISKHLQWSTQTGALVRRLSNHNVFWKQKIPIFFFWQTDQWNSSFTYTTVKNFETAELTWPLRKQPSNLWMLLVCKKKKGKTWECFVFKKRCDWQSLSKYPCSNSCTIEALLPFHTYDFVCSFCHNRACDAIKIAIVN